MEVVGFRLEDAPCADDVKEEQAGHRAVAGERREDRPDRDLGLGDRVVFGGDGALHLGHELVRGRAHELAEDRLLGREMEVDPALGGLGRGRDIVHGGFPVAAARRTS